MMPPAQTLSPAMDPPPPAPSGKIIFIMGPTAVGKSAWALTMAEQFNLEIVNADSIQIYKELNIGAAKPTLAERQRIAHHLLDLTTIDDPFSAGRYQRHAWETIIACQQRGKTPLLVGGTGLYFRSVEEGIANIPAIDPQIAAQLDAEGEKMGWASLYPQLMLADPVWGKNVLPQDRQRIRRGLAVYLSTGVPLSEWHRRQPPKPNLSILKMAITAPMNELFLRIDRRFDAMIAQGFLNEAQEILNYGYNRDLPAMKAVGYRQLFDHLDGTIHLHEAIEQGKRASRHYARRQLTWLHKENNLHWLKPDELAIAQPIIAKHLQADHV